MTDSALTPAELAHEQAGLEFMRNGKFRKARDAFKLLHKSQPARALPLLIEANLGLASEMMSKGLVSEANQVLAYLKTIAPASTNLALKEVPKPSSRDAWSSMVPLAAQRLSTATEPAAAIRAADEMILGAESPDHPGHPDAKAILCALELGYSAALSEQTSPLLRSIPRSSPFSHWVYFFKGMAALESGSHARAADYFRRLPESSLLQASLPALLTICGADSAKNPDPNAAYALCTWAGYPALAEPLFQAEKLWQKGRQAKAFAILTNKIPGLICWGAKSLQADLSRFLTVQFTRASVDNEESYSSAVIDYSAPKSRRVAQAVIDRAFFLVNYSDYRICAHEHFRIASEKFNTMREVAKLSPAMCSRFFSHLAEEYITDLKKSPDDRCNPPIAKLALEKAIQHDPSHLNAWLKKCDLMAMGKDSSAYHRFVDELTKHFPNEKDVFIRNGECCIARGSFTKALRNFECAAEMDSVDPDISRGMLRARLGIAEETYKKRKSSKVNWEPIEALASANKSCPRHSLWRLRARQIALEAHYGADHESLAALVTATRPLAPSEFQLKAACRISTAKYKFAYKPSFWKKLFSTDPVPQTFEDFLATMDDAEACEDRDSYDFACKAVQSIFAEHAKELLECVAERKHLIALLIKVFSRRKLNLNLVSPVIQKWYSPKRPDPILSFLCSYYGFGWLTTTRRGNLDAIESEIQNSKNSDDQRLLMLIKSSHRRSYGGHDRVPKLDFDYDPHGMGELRDQDDKNGDDDRIAEIIQQIGKTSAKMSKSELSAAIEKMIVESLSGSGNAVPRPKPIKSIKLINPNESPPQKELPSTISQLSFDEMISPPTS